MSKPMHANARREGIAFFILFVATIPAANWAIGNIGFVCPPGEPCLIPVAPGLWAPSAVPIIGLAFVFRDLVQRRLGINWAMIAILVGTAVSGFVAPPTLVLASVTAFLISELADLFVYTPLQRRGLVLAVVASSVVGLCVDSVVFLTIAFGNLEYLWGQVVGKLWAVAAALPLIQLIRRRDSERGIIPV